MAKKFGSSPAAKRFDEVAKSSMANSDFLTVKLIENEKIANYPYNSEDISYSEDIENSIREIGFTDPLEVTDYQMPPGRYMIVSGHRRRAAGVKCGMELFPCIIRAFTNEKEMQNYVLLSNTYRSSDRDPLLYCKRYKMHEQYLHSIGFKGAFHEEIAKRLGVTQNTAHTYRKMNQVILPVWDLVREESIAISTVVQISTLTAEHQHAVYQIFKEHILKRIDLTVESVREILYRYNNNQKYEADKKARAASEEPAGPKTSFQNSQRIIKAIRSLDKNIYKFSDCKSSADAEIFLRDAGRLVEVLLDKSYFISQQHGLERETQKIMKKITKKINKTKFDSVLNDDSDDDSDV